MKSSIVLRGELDEASQAANTILDHAESESRELSIGEKKEFDRLMASISLLKDDLVRQERAESLRSDELKAKYGDLPSRDDDPLATPHPFSMRKNAASVSSMFRSQHDRTQVVQFFKGLVAGDHASIRNSLSTFDNGSGGYTVPSPLANAIVELRQARGVARQYCQVVNMTSNTLAVPKLASEVTPHFVGESEEINDSSPTFDQVVLSAKKLASLVPMSSEIEEDAAITLVEMLARSVAYGFASREDECLFNGDATSTYGHIKGLKESLLAGSKHTATSQTSFSALTLAQFEAVVGKAKRWASSETPRWYFSRPGYYASAARLVNAAGGNDTMSLGAGPSEISFMGYPVTFADCLHSNLGASTGAIACYFGDLRSGVYMGSRRNITLAVDGSARFTSDQLLFRATERFDIVVHDVGTATDSGGIVALVFG